MMTVYQTVLPLLMAIAPTIAVLALFVRLGQVLKAVQKAELALDRLEPIVSDLRAWRDASHAMNSDLLQRVRRLEDSHFRGLES